MDKDFFVPTNEGSLSSTSLTLLDKVRRKESKAWDRLVSLYTPLVWYWCKPWNLQSADLEDVIQDVFVTVFRSLENFHRDQEGDSFRKWLKTITRNKLASRTIPPGGKGEGGSTAEAMLREVADACEALAEEPSAQALERSILYNRALELIESNFEPKTRRAFWLLIGGYKPKEVAAQLEMSQSAVYSGKCNILRCLRQEFRGLLDIGPRAGT